MRVLIPCEFSGIVREAFRRRGHDAWSCDLLPTEISGQHIQGNIINHNIIKRGWDLLIAFPDCTFLTGSGARWMKIEWRRQAQLWALQFVKTLWSLPIPKKCIENPIGRLSTLWKPPSQIIQPYEFGHGETKATCLWLENLPLLKPTKIVAGRIARVHREAPGPERWKNRSRTYQGIAEAMAEQWG